MAMAHGTTCCTSNCLPFGSDGSEWPGLGRLMQTWSDRRRERAGLVLSQIEKTLLRVRGGEAEAHATAAQQADSAYMARNPCRPRVSRALKGHPLPMQRKATTPSVTGPTSDCNRRSPWVLQLTVYSRSLRQIYGFSASKPISDSSFTYSYISLHIPFPNQISTIRSIFENAVSSIVDQCQAMIYKYEQRLDWRELEKEL